VAQTHLTTLAPVEVAARPWAAYRGVAPDALLDEAEALASRLRGLRVVHVNATAYGGGVAELLSSEIGLLRDLGIEGICSAPTRTCSR
jgi:trehalose synthase